MARQSSLREETSSVPSTQLVVDSPTRLLHAELRAEALRRQLPLHEVLRLAAASSFLPTVASSSVPSPNFAGRSNAAFAALALSDGYCSASFDPVLDTAFSATEASDSESCPQRRRLQRHSSAVSPPVAAAATQTLLWGETASALLSLKEAKTPGGATPGRRNRGRPLPRVFWMPRKFLRQFGEDMASEVVSQRVL